MSARYHFKEFKGDGSGYEVGFQALDELREFITAYGSSEVPSAYKTEPKKADLPPAVPPENEMVAWKEGDIACVQLNTGLVIGRITSIFDGKAEMISEKGEPMTFRLESLKAHPAGRKA